MNNVQSALDKIKNKQFRVEILRLDYVGFRLLWTFLKQV